ncbi:MAG TPA: NTP transferase domain-containing protein, partial [Nitrospirota bacterium]|nr:NTP transferase domain-containing protein [Nitrospirota bacterium]
MKGLAVVVLAAGLGTRMKSSLAKVLHPLAGSPMLSHVLLSVTRLRPDKVVVVVGHQADKVRALLPDGAQTADQKEQLGTAHAALTGLKRLGRYDGTLLLVSGDTPLMTAETLRRLLDAHKKSGAQVSILTASPAEPKGYGRIIRDGSGAVKGIVEEKDASPAEKSIGEI